MALELLKSPTKGRPGCAARGAGARRKAAGWAVAVAAPSPTNSRRCPKTAAAAAAASASSSSLSFALEFTSAPLVTLPPAVCGNDDGSSSSSHGSAQQRPANHQANHHPSWLPPPPSPTSSSPTASTSSQLRLAPPCARAVPVFDARPFDDVYELDGGDGELVGEGTYGRVRTCVERATGHVYAVKVLPRRSSGRRAGVDMTPSAANEAAMGARVAAAGCGAVARTYALHLSHTEAFIVQDLLPGGSLQSLLDAAAAASSRGGSGSGSGSGSGALDAREAAAAVRGVLTALAACHAEGVVYGDVKPSNVVLAALYPSVEHLLDPAAPKGALDARLVDFGCARACAGPGGLEGLSGTPAYVAPEVASGKPYGCKSDVFGAGVLLHQLLTGRWPYDWPAGAPPALERVLRDVRAGAVRLDGAVALGAPAAALPLLRAMLEVDPARRATAAEALRDPWLNEAADAQR